MEDVFKIFDLPRAYKLDPDQLQQRFIQLSSAQHPDRFSDALEQAEAAEQIAAINQAYMILKDPARRAEALIDLIRDDAEAKAQTSKKDELPPDFLMEVMEIRESLQDALESGDQDKLREIQAWAETERQNHLNQIAVAFDAHMNSVTTDTTPDGLVSKVQMHVNVLRYLDRMLEQSSAD